MLRMSIGDDNRYIRVGHKICLLYIPLKNEWENNCEYLQTNYIGVQIIEIFIILGIVN